MTDFVTKLSVTKPPATILVADDDQSIRTVLYQALSDQGYHVRTTGTVAQLWDWVRSGEGDMVITDVVMPDEDGLDLVPRILKMRPAMRVVVVSAQSTLSTAVRANQKGAFEYLPKPFDLKEVIEVVERALNVSAESPALPIAGPVEEGLPLVGRSAAMQDVYRILGRLVGTDLTTLISGESGTGKELVACALHRYSKRSSRPFVAVNMAAIPRELIESELFGHEKGAFTGAIQRNPGRFEQAAGGTLFLDEIGDMPLDAQTRLLRVLQEGEYIMVGGRRPVRADARIIAATHRDLRQLVRQGVFREDLFYRLNVVPVRLPPLRERSADIPDLVAHFSAQLADENLLAKQIDAGGMAFLKSYHWPGNVRELENLVRRLAALYSQETIGRGVLEKELTGSEEEYDAPSESLREAAQRHLRRYFDAHGDELPAAGLYKRVLNEVEFPLISLCLEASRGNQLQAARILGINRNTLRKKIRELDIPSARPGRS